MPSHVLFFNSDTGNRDLGAERTFPNNIDEHVVLQTARDLATENGSNSVVVIRTKPYGKKTGQWYIKGFRGKVPYETIRKRVEENQQTFSRRECWLIRLE